MSNTPNLSLPLLMEAQAQKHVTVNEAIVRLDALGQLVLQSVDQSDPPASPGEGESYGVPATAAGDWVAQSGAIAVWSNGGWIYVQPRIGWRAFVRDQGACAVFDGSAWRVGILALSEGSAATRHMIIEIDHILAAGSSNAVSAAIPSGSLVFGVTGRVTVPFVGSLSHWRLGVGGSDDRYGSGLGLAQGSWVRGLTGTPLAYYSDTDLLLSAEGGDFASGAVRLAVHCLQLDVAN